MTGRRGRRRNWTRCGPAPGPRGPPAARARRAGLPRPSARPSAAVPAGGPIGPRPPNRSSGDHHPFRGAPAP